MSNEAYDSGIKRVEMLGRIETIPAEDFSYNIKRLEPFKAKLRKESPTDVVSIALLGDSITEGGNATDFMINSFSSILRDVLQSKYGSAGSGFLSAWRKKTTTTSLWTQTGTWAVSTASAQGPVGASATITFTGTDVDFVYFRNPGTGTITVEVDGGGPTTINTNNPATVIAVHSITGLAPGSHTLVVTNTDASRVCLICGIRPKNGNTGVRLDNYGVWGTKTDRLGQAQYKSLAFSDVADLYVLSYTANDFLQQTSLATYKSFLDAMVKEILAKGSSILLVANGLATDAKTVEQLWFTKSLYQLADEFGLPLIDINTKWGDANNAKTNDLLISDNVHPTDKGHKDIANQILRHFFN